MSAAQPTVVVLDSSDERKSFVARLLGDRVTVSGDLAAALARSGPVVLVDLAMDLKRGLRTLQEVRRAAPATPIVAFADRKDPDLILCAMRAGANEFAIIADGQEFARIVHAFLRQTSSEVRHGRILTIYGAKGGIGATTIATNLADALCALGKRVLLVDLDRQLSDALVYLDLVPRYTIADVIENLHRLDRELLLSSLGRHKSGLYVLPQPDSFEDGKSTSASHVPSWLSLVARHFDYVVCDGIGRFDDFNLAVLDSSDRVELLLSQDVVTLKNARRSLDIFQRLNYGAYKVALVVNRYLKRAPIDLASIEDALGAEVRATLANDYAAALAALNNGVPLRQAAPRSNLTRDIERLAADTAGVEPAKRSGLGALFRRSPPKPPPALTQSLDDRNLGDTVVVARRTPQTS